MRFLPLLFSLALSTNAVAQDVQIIGTIDQTLHVPQSTLLKETPEKQSIKLLKVQLSDRAISTLNKRARATINKTINEIKSALNEHDRVTLGVFLIDFDLGTAGAAGTHMTNFDTWVLTPEIARNIYLRPLFGGHEMIITGYDDDAVAIDDQGRQYKGLFTLRNSSGEHLENKGDVYMSYDYFKVLVNEAQRIRTLPSENENPSVTTA